MVLSNGAVLVRVKTMADGSKRAEIDFGEHIKLGNFDDLLQTTITVVLVSDQEAENLQIDKIINDEK